MSVFEAFAEALNTRLMTVMERPTIVEANPQWLADMKRWADENHFMVRDDSGKHTEIAGIRVRENEGLAYGHFIFR